MNKPNVKLLEMEENFIQGNQKNQMYILIKQTLNLNTINYLTDKKII